MTLKAPKASKVFVCSFCDAQYPKWIGRCEQCGKWGSIPNDAIAIASESDTQVTVKGVVKKPMILMSDVHSTSVPRLVSGVKEFDRVLGGGIVPGSLILLGGDPGVGKSTLVLEVAYKLAQENNAQVLYVSGEETVAQVADRARRLGIKGNQLLFLEGDVVENIVATTESTKPVLVIVDSIQTIHSTQVASEEGSVPQVKACTSALLHMAKTSNIPVILIGHVTKDGAVAGPMALEHLVDTVLYLEGEMKGSYRILRSVKHRFGSTDEVGVFEMKEEGLVSVDNTAALFLRFGNTQCAGCITTCIIEGRRSFLVEAQALVARTVFGYPKRAVSGSEVNRVQLLLAVLSSKADVDLSAYDVYVNVAGGFKLREPSSDLALCLAIVSATHNLTTKEPCIVIGEVGLSGDVRPVPQLERRVQEAYNLGFKKFIVPKNGELKPLKGVDVYSISSVTEAIEQLKKV